MGGVARTLLVAAGLAVASAGLQVGCATRPAPGEGEGRWHVVSPGETLWALAQRYEVDVGKIEQANAIKDVHGLQVGQLLWIPGGRDLGPEPDAPFPPARGRARPSGDCRDPRTGVVPPFAWPIDGTLTSSFGRRGSGRHDGIDLGARKGTPVHAAAAGRVIYSGSDLGAYGKVVIVKHAGSWATVYAHNRRNLVGQGSFVEKGDVIAEVGDTGNASAPHLHFEVRLANVPQDPLACLP
jgi:murein DD-endopeptidase MepM/ murein hydrolase activator NlpD